MSWPLRTLALTVAVLWAAAPQLACLRPDEMLTAPEMDCCKQMAQECGGMNMSQECCPAVPRADIEIAAKPVRNTAPQFNVTETIEAAASPLLTGARRLIIHSVHAPPYDPEGSSPILRI